jgi:hypothetical protein
MAEKTGILHSFRNFQATKTQLFWSCAVCVVAALIGGFTWGGWVTGGTAKDMASNAAIGARAELAAAICVEKFAAGPDAKAKLASLKDAASYLRNDMIEKDGWVTMIGAEKPVTGAAALCVRQLMDATLPLTKPAKTSG